MCADLYQTPWSREIGATRSTAVFDRNGALIGSVQRREHADLLVLAPDALRLLCRLVSAIYRMDPDYCRSAGLARPTEAELGGILAEARLLIRVADALDVPCEVVP